MLEPVLGVGRAIARATVELDFRETQRTQEAFDPAGQVARSHQKEVEEPATLPGGVPGVQTNIPGGDAGKASPDGPVKKSNEISNYEITKTTNQVAEPRGQIRRLSIAVLVDGKYEGGNYVLRTSEEMETLKAVVMKAVGFNAERGDQLEVANIPFKAGPPPPEQVVTGPFDLQQWIRTPQGMQVVGGSLLALLILLSLGRWRRRARLARLAQQRLAIEQQAQGAGWPGGEQTITQVLEKKSMAPTDRRREELIGLAREHQGLVVQVLRMWLREEKQRMKAEQGWGATPLADPAEKS
jgi:flagellar M-ring protein FliF